MSEGMLHWHCPDCGWFVSRDTSAEMNKAIAWHGLKDCCGPWSAVTEKPVEVVSGEASR